MTDLLFIFLSSCFAIGLEFGIDVFIPRKSFKLSLLFYGTYFTLYCLSIWLLISIFNNIF